MCVTEGLVPFSCLTYLAVRCHPLILNLCFTDDFSGPGGVITGVCVRLNTDHSEGTCNHVDTDAEMPTPDTVRRTIRKLDLVRYFELYKSVSSCITSCHVESTCCYTCRALCALWVCLLSASVSPAKTAELIKMPFVGGRSYGLNNFSSEISRWGAHWRHLANTVEQSVRAAMRSCVKLLWPFV